MWVFKNLFNTCHMQRQEAVSALRSTFRQGEASTCYIEPGARQLDSQAVIPALLLTQ